MRIVLTLAVALALVAGLTTGLKDTDPAHALEFREVFPGWNMVAVHGDLCFEIENYSEYGIEVIAWWDAPNQEWQLASPFLTELGVNDFNEICPPKVYQFLAQEQTEIPLP